MRKSIILGVVSWALTISNALADIDVLFSPEGGVANRVVSEIGRANRQIDVAMYSFSDRSIKAALLAAAQRGVVVRLLLDNARERSVLASEVEGAGVDVRFVLPTMHHKFAIIDGPSGDALEAAATATLITGSANWSPKSDQDYDEDFLVFRGEAEKVLAFQGEFDFLWEHSREFPGAATALVGRVPLPRQDEDSTVFTSMNFEVFKSRGEWSYRSVASAEEGVAGAALIKAIDAATAKIRIATTHLRRRDFFDALLRAVERGVQVEMVLDQQEFRGIPPGPGAAESSDLYYDEMLAERGVTVKYKLYMIVWNAARAAQMHSKYMIVDDRTVYAGSFNWSKNSETESFENLNIIDDSETVNAYVANFDRVSTYGGSDGVARLRLAVEGQNHLGPCQFEPISVSVEEFLAIRKMYKSGACRGGL